MYFLAYKYHHSTKLHVYCKKMYHEFVAAGILSEEYSSSLHVQMQCT